jgi:hypothetical protein
MAITARRQSHRGGSLEGRMSTTRPGESEWGWCPARMKRSAVGVGPSGAKRVASVCCALVLLCPLTAVAQRDLERARTLYNAGQFDESIAAAAEAKNKAAAAPSATLIAARARLERFRQKTDPEDLAAARAELISLNPRILAAQELIEWQIGIGTALFLEDQPGPAAEMFTTVLPTARGLPPAQFAKLLEWWASTLSRVAESLSGMARKNAYAAMLSAVRGELERDPLSRPAAYWLVVAARGTGDFDGAWNSAVTGWIRAGSQSEGQQLRSDLDRFVTQTLIPERAQARTGQPLDAKATLLEISALTEQWRALGEQWRSPS